MASFFIGFLVEKTAFPLSMIAPVKKSVNHSRTVASMRETGWEQQQHDATERTLRRRGCGTD